MSYLEIHDRGGARYVPTDRYFTLGRSLSNSIVLHGNTVSRNHARICWQRNRIFLQDLGSTYGTLVNERYVQGDALLCDGDRMQMGDVYIVFHERPRAGTDAGEQTPPFGVPRPQPPPDTRLGANMVHCPRCGTPNLRNNSACYRCGSPLLLLAEPLAAPANSTAGRSRAGASIRQPATSWLTAFLIALAVLVLCVLSVILGLLLASGPLTGLV